MAGLVIKEILKIYTVPVSLQKLPNLDKLRLLDRENPTFTDIR